MLFYIKKTVSKLMLYHMGEIFISKLTEIKFEIWRVTFFLKFFTFTEIGCLATGPGDLKFTTDSLPLFGLNETFIIAKSKVSVI